MWNTNGVTARSTIVLRHKVSKKANAPVLFSVDNPINLKLNQIQFGFDQLLRKKEVSFFELKCKFECLMEILGDFVQSLVTGVGPYQNLLDHLADPFNNNIFVRKHGIHGRNERKLKESFY
ncbi:type III chlorophyll A/B-binding protein, putative [Medicago truncatula]|uniref:Type III chlorophyll A/B-binding protein, putative n=1 Tax=Medicago truncatula TaxID=3880 RepID=G7K0Q3_MEDTR|nr:type III chlorophyll A/B-binding protein, putative [Medicago truncatula]